MSTDDDDDPTQERGFVSPMDLDETDPPASAFDPTEPSPVVEPRLVSEGDSATVMGAMIERDLDELTTSVDQRKKLGRGTEPQAKREAIVESDEELPTAKSADPREDSTLETPVPDTSASQPDKPKKVVVPTLSLIPPKRFRRPPVETSGVEADAGEEPIARGARVWVVAALVCLALAAVALVSALTTHDDAEVEITSRPLGQ